MCTSKCWLTIGAALAGLAVAAGAFAAQGLDNRFHQAYADQTFEKKVTRAGVEKVVYQVPLAQKYLADFKTGAEYQMYHGLALLVVGLLSQARRSKALDAAGFCFVAGCLGFSGGLYAYTLTGVKWIGMFIVPLGGMLFLAGWISLAIAVCPCRGNDSFNRDS
jgi:uncharacterized membrane protein YgdD (TMEM256/DUF423 family)